jgi:hypothetical protein
MQRSAALCALIVVLSVGAVPAALAQRDPFEPLVSQDGGSGAAPAEDRLAPVPGPRPADGAPEGLPATGSDVLDPLAVAYVLIALGGGSLLYRRLAR